MAISGKSGQVDDGAEVTGMKSWTIELTYAALDVTDFADGGESKFIPGISEWHGSFEGYKDTTPIVIGTPITITLWEQTGAAKKFYGPAIITNLRGSTDHDGIPSYSYDFQGTGTLNLPA